MLAPEQASFVVALWTRQVLILLLEDLIHEEFLGRRPRNTERVREGLPLGRLDQPLIRTINPATVLDASLVLAELLVAEAIGDTAAETPSV